MNTKFVKSERKFFVDRLAALLDKYNVEYVIRTEEGQRKVGGDAPDDDYGYHSVKWYYLDAEETAAVAMKAARKSSPPDLFKPQEEVDEAIVTIYQKALEKLLK